MNSKSVKKDQDMHFKPLANLAKKVVIASNRHFKPTLTGIIFSVLFVFTSLFGAVLFAATHYVSPSGSASWTQSINIGSPCSVTTAMSNAVAGDVVIFLDGTYNVGQQGSDYTVPVLNPAHNGTPGNEIIFRAQNHLGAILNGTVKEGEYNCNVLGAYNRSYIIWDGFKVTANKGAYMATVRFEGNASHCTIKNSEIVGASHSTGGAINYEGIRIEHSSYILVQNCSIHGFIETSNNHNTSGFKGYWTDHVTIENCEIYDCTAGLYPKNGNDNLTIRNNYIHDCYLAYYIAQDAGNGSTNVQVYDNLITNCTFALDRGNGSYSFNGFVYHNNTIYNCGHGIGYYATPDMKIYNNIIQATPNQLTGTECNALLAECDHNQFGISTLSIIMRHYCETEKDYNSLASWQSSGELNGGGNPGVGSLASDPKFVNASGNMNQIADFALSSDSPCKGTGRNGVDMGANISLVGIQRPPAVPSNLRIPSNN